MDVITKTVVVIVLITGSCLVEAIVLTKIWHWYIEPAFDVNPLRVVEAYGVALAVGLVAQNKVDNNRKTEEYEARTAFGRIAGNTMSGVATCMIVLLAAWIGSFFV